MEDYITGTGQHVRVHDKKDCTGNCCIHNPSDHHMVDWPTHWRDDRGLMERICPHGIGHPDPDDIEFKRQKFDDKFAEIESVHGCDGCCDEALYLAKIKEKDPIIQIFNLKNGIRKAIDKLTDAGDNRPEVLIYLKRLLKEGKL